MAPLRCWRALGLALAALAVAGAAAPSAPPPDNSACGTAYHGNATRMLRLAPKEGFGVIFVAHHGDEAKKQTFVKHAIESATSYRDASIKLPRALITSAGGPQRGSAAWLRGYAAAVAHVPVPDAARSPQTAIRSTRSS